MLKPDLGPSEHIRAGLEELGKSFTMEQVVLDFYANNRHKPVESAKATGPLWGRYSKWIGLFRDLKRLFVNHLSFFSWFSRLKRLQPDFIYERSAYLNFNGLMIAKLLKIPHFYEANWVHYLGMRQFYSSHFSLFAKRLEEIAYNRSDHVFFVGSQDRYLRLAHLNWSVIQNGVQNDIIQGNARHVNQFFAPVHVVMVANLMPHHRFDLLLDALPLLKHPERLHFHFVGFRFKSALAVWPNHIAHTHHGPVVRDRLPELFKCFHAGLVTGDQEYGSYMKLFEYAAAKLVVVCPELDNLRRTFSDKEILFFKTNDPSDLAAKLDLLCCNPQIAGKGVELYKRVKNEFTWEAVFKPISSRIQAYLVAS